MDRMNLSAWALKHQSFVLFLILLLGGAGVYAYTHLGQMEDPAFTVKAMVVQTYWPGATANEVAQQVTDRIEKKLQEIAEIDYLTSFSKPGTSRSRFRCAKRCRRRTCPTSGTRCARSSATSATRCRPT